MSDKIKVTIQTHGSIASNTFENNNDLVKFFLTKAGNTHLLENCKIMDNYKDYQPYYYGNQLRMQIRTALETCEDFITCTHSKGEAQ